MKTNEVAESISEALQHEIGDNLLAVGWYNEAIEPRTDTVFMSDSFDEHEETGRGVLESALLESVGKTSYESVHGEELTITMRFYETIVDLTLYLEELGGIVIAFESRGCYQIEDIIDTVREAIPQNLKLKTER